MPWLGCRAGPGPVPWRGEVAPLLRVRTSVPTSCVLITLISSTSVIIYTVHSHPRCDNNTSEYYIRNPAVPEATIYHGHVPTRPEFISTNDVASLLHAFWGSKD